jgi:hypothetical protein
LVIQIKSGFVEGNDLVVTVQSAMGEEHICALKDIAPKVNFLLKGSQGNGEPLYLKTKLENNYNYLWWHSGSCIFYGFMTSSAIS